MNQNAYLRTDFFLEINGSEDRKLFTTTHPKVFRQDFTQPGFAVLDFGRNYSPEKLRAAMVALKNALQERCEQESGLALHYQ